MEPRFKVGDPVTVVDRPDPVKKYFCISEGIFNEAVGCNFEVSVDCGTEGGDGIQCYRLKDSEFVWPEYLLEPVQG